MYFVKTAFWLKKIYPSLVWNKVRTEKKVFLTFDDGPNEKVTAFVLSELKRNNALATFFCIGKNVECNEELYKEILAEGHSVGNHTHNHVNGWKVSCTDYLENVMKAEYKIHSKLFRPPYGRIKKSQIQALKKRDYKIIMWDVLSGDFDLNLSKERCLKNVIENVESGSIIVFHDSEKAFEKLQYVLPKVLEYFSKEGFTFSSL